jgi:hypothetical protein
MSARPREHDVSEDELLARYILRKEFVRSDGTLKPDPFIPYRDTKLSVTRHMGLSEATIWGLGEEIARHQQKTLYGRGDASVRVYLHERLQVVPDPVEGNPNHANVSNWPADKPSQKAIALEIVKSVRYLPKPGR